MQRRAAAQYGGTERHSSWSYDLFPSASRTARCHLVRANRSFPKPSAARIWLTSQPHFRRERWLHSKISGRWLGRQFQNPHLCFLRPNPRGRRRFKHRQNLLLIAGIGTHQSIDPSWVAKVDVLEWFQRRAEEAHHAHNVSGARVDCGHRRWRGRQGRGCVQGGWPQN